MATTGAIVLASTASRASVEEPWARLAAALAANHDPRLSQPIEWASYTQRSFVHHVQINHRRRNVRVPQ